MASSFIFNFCHSVGGFIAYIAGLVALTALTCNEDIKCGFMALFQLPPKTSVKIEQFLLSKYSISCRDNRGNQLTDQKHFKRKQKP